MEFLNASWLLCDFSRAGFKGVERIGWHCWSILAINDFHAYIYEIMEGGEVILSISLRYFSQKSLLLISSCYQICNIFNQFYANNACN